jgi:DtxR family Mn-dependent transcriptional regulator
MGVNGESWVHSRAIQDYIKVIFKLEQGAAVSTSAIALRMGVSQGSVTEMVKKLAQAGLVTHSRYQGVTLTGSGRSLALEMIRHHRLIELYLHKALGFSWDQVDAEAERLEHVISEEMEAAMAAWLNEPTEDPHGDPIPSKDGVISLIRFLPLTGILPGQSVRIRRVSDSDPSLLRYLGERGLYPHVELDIVSQEPFGGPLLVRVAGVEHALGVGVTDRVFVELVEATC